MLRQMRLALTILWKGNDAIEIADKIEIQNAILQSADVSASLRVAGCGSQRSCIAQPYLSIQVRKAVAGSSRASIVAPGLPSSPLATCVHLPPACGSSKLGAGMPARGSAHACHVHPSPRAVESDLARLGNARGQRRDHRRGACVVGP